VALPLQIEEVSIGEIEVFDWKLDTRIRGEEIYELSRILLGQRA
jgi:hypothetical protein